MKVLLMIVASPPFTWKICATSICCDIVAKSAVVDAERAAVYIDSSTTPISDLALGDGQVVYCQVAGAGNIENAIGVVPGRR